MEASTEFFESVIGAGAILSGFCGTFLAFRIQRESNYYRQPAVNFEYETAKDIFVGKTCFSPAFKLLVFGTCCSVVFGFMFPLLALAGSVWILARKRLVAAALIGTVVLIGVYFFAELVHYEIPNIKFLRGKCKAVAELLIVYAGLIVAFLLSLFAYCSMRSW